MQRKQGCQTSLIYEGTPLPPGPCLARRRRRYRFGPPPLPLFPQWSKVNPAARSFAELIGTTGVAISAR
ncbi:hypothetical protein FB565_006569 [Actinoplanes lutulentus]|uniref:Uncharacterized protein n=1 Tax=Actinoplanes lutulentus TaxID=1287878 RepID=A0A327ZAR6_9ACTN|nr:hypothetical protein [Actinoplanes lutulentus]RAK35693.1 hypothetical protein B0I29_109167 [Actinoplanes lutulentus]